MISYRPLNKVVDLILALEAKVTNLERRLNKNSQNSDKSPSSDGLSKPPRQRSKSKRQSGGQKGHPGTTLKFSHNPDKIIQHGADYCQDCGESLTQVGGIVLSRRQEIDPDHRTSTSGKAVSLLWPPEPRPMAGLSDGERAIWPALQSVLSVSAELPVAAL